MAMTGLAQPVPAGQLGHRPTGSSCSGTGTANPLEPLELMHGAAQTDGAVVLVGSPSARKPPFAGSIPG